MGYAVSRAGTFGVVVRRYRTESGIPMVIIRWGPLRWLTPIREEDVRFLESSYELDARKEADAWLESLEEE